MSEKPPTSPRTLAELNKQILEIKKKIQLSEGQRKAAFEQYETERKQNADQILKLKREIKELTIKLQQNKDETAAHRIDNVKLEHIVGPLVHKTTNQVMETLNLQIIDKKKQLDLIRYNVKQKEKHLSDVAKEYQELLAKKPKKEVANIENPFKKNKKKTKIEKPKQEKTVSTEQLSKPYKKKVSVLQNEIHRVELQWREAEHIRNSYKAIKSALLKDSGNFESTLQQLEERIQNQQKDIDQLQKMNGEASVSRENARSGLEREERLATTSCKTRERQAAEQRNLVADRRTELERLERRIFQSGRTAAAPQTTDVVRPDTADEAEHTADEESSDDNDEDEQAITEAFERLKEATGATSSDDVLSRFQAQRETKIRLDYLKQTTENEKHELELKQEQLVNELERYKFAQEKDKEKYSDEILELKRTIQEQQELADKCEEQSKEQETLLESLCKTLYNLYLSLKDIGIIPLKEINANPENGKNLLENLLADLENMVQRSEQEDEEEKEEEIKIKEDENEEIISDEDVLPPSYNTLIRRTPVSQQTQVVQISTPAAVSEDEEEVPSRGFLKRQAQIVIDAKSRRKPLRVPINK